MQGGIATPGGAGWVIALQKIFQLRFDVLRFAILFDRVSFFQTSPSLGEGRALFPPFAAVLHKCLQSVYNVLPLGYVQGINLRLEGGEFFVEKSG